MGRKRTANTKGKIISAAWRLFYEQGYEETTIDDIIAESGTSRGSFYHYFEGKDALLGSLSYLFDEKYTELEPKLSGFATCMEQLIFLNQELFGMIENSIAIELPAFFCGLAVNIIVSLATAPPSVEIVKEFESV